MGRVGSRAGSQEPFSHLEVQEVAQNPLPDELCRASRSVSPAGFISLSCMSGRQCGWDSKPCSEGRAEPCTHSQHALCSLKYPTNLCLLASYMNLLKFHLPEESGPLAGALHAERAWSPGNIAAFG